MTDNKNKLEKTVYNQATTGVRFKTKQRNSEETQEDREYQAYANAQYKNFYGRGENKYAIYPSYWNEKWGRPPLLGIVFADNEFLAERLAYDRGILPSPCNCTFQAKIKHLGAVKTYEPRAAAV